MRNFSLKVRILTILIVYVVANFNAVANGTIRFSWEARTSWEGDGRTEEKMFTVHRQINVYRCKVKCFLVNNSFC